MRTRPWMLVPLAALLASAAHASGPEAGRWSMSLTGGADIPFSGDVHDGAVAAVPDLGPLNPALTGVDAELRIGARSHDRIYGSAMTYGLEFAYGLNDHAEMFVRSVVPKPIAARCRSVERMCLPWRPNCR